MQERFAKRVSKNSAMESKREEMMDVTEDMENMEVESSKSSNVRMRKKKT